MPGFFNFSATTLASATVNSYLMRQAVIQCTSSTRPSSPHNGMQIEETDTGRTYKYNGTAWVLTGARSAAGRCGMKVNIQGIVPLPSGTYTSFAWLTAGAVDTHGSISQYSPSGRYVVPIDGLWDIAFYIDWSAAWSATNNSFVRLLISGSEPHDFVVSSISGKSAGATKLALTAGATIDIGVLQNSGAVQAWTNNSHVQMWRSSP